MRNTIIKEIKELCAEKRIWIGILTVLIIIIIGTSYNKKNNNIEPLEQLKLGVINNDDSSYSDLLLSYFNSSETFSSLITVVLDEGGTVKEAFDKGELDIYLEIPKDFAVNMMKLKHSPINVTLNTMDSTKAILFQNVLKSYERYIAAVEANAVGLYEIMQQDGMDQKLIDDTNRIVSIDLIFTTLGKEAFFSYQPISRFPTTTLLEYYISSVLVMALLYFGLFTGFQILTERKQGTFARLRTTKTSLHRFLVAKIFLIIIILTISFAIALSLIGGKPANVSSGLFCIAVSMFSVCLALALSAIFNTIQRFVLIGNLLIFYFTVLGGGIIPVQFLPQDMLLLSRMTPYYYMMKGIFNVTSGQLSDINQITIGLILLSILLYGIAVLLFEKRSVAYEEV
jgi:ABC-2 type transport system permease protein